MVLNLSNATSFFNAEEVTISHDYGLVVNLENGIVSVSEVIDSDLVYNYTIIQAKKDGVEKDIAIGSIDILDENNLEELREFYGYYEGGGGAEEEEEDSENNNDSSEYTRNLDDDDEDEYLASRGKGRGY